MSTLKYKESETGEWKVANSVKVINSGGASIDVTAEVGQTIAVKEVDANGKPTKWESAEYQPRTHWSEIADILTETTLELIPDMGFMLNSALPLTAGQEYTVIFNGTEYVLECIDIGGMFVLGIQIATNENGETIYASIDGVPFNVMTGLYPGVGDVTAVTPEDTELTSITFGVKGEQVHKIPEKYLPAYQYQPLTITFYYDADSDSYSAPTANVQVVEEALSEGREIKGVISRSVDNLTFPLFLVAYSQDGKETGYGRALCFKDMYMLGKLLGMVPQEDGTYAVSAI